MATITYTETEQLLIEYNYDFTEIPTYELEELARTIDAGKDVWVAIELGRCPSTDIRTYILHTYQSKPELNYYCAEKLNNKILSEKA